jgi:hypothetical protein
MAKIDSPRGFGRSEHKLDKTCKYYKSSSDDKDLGSDVVGEGGGIRFARPIPRGLTVSMTYLKPNKTTVRYFDELENVKSPKAHPLS